MGERSKAQGTLFQPQFNRAVTVEPSDQLLTEHAGALLLRQAAEDLGVVGALAILDDPRLASRVIHPLSELVMTSVLLLAQGERQQDAADELRGDGALRVAVSERGGDRPLQAPRHGREPGGLGSQPTLSRMTASLSSEQNLSALRAIVLDTSVRRIESLGPRNELVIDVDSFGQETHGSQEDSAYNGHYHMTCVHPLIAFTDTGDIVGVEIRPGNVHTAYEVRPFLEPIIEAARHLAEELWVRIDAGYASGEFFDWLEERDVHWVTRLRNNSVLDDAVAKWRERTEAAWAKEGPSQEPRTALFEFQHQAGKWSRERRVIAVLLERKKDDGELFNDRFYLATSDAEEAIDDVLQRYRDRGKAEQYIGEYKRTLRPSTASHDNAKNQVNFLLAAIAYELMHHVREAVAGPVGAPRMTLATLRDRVLKVATIIVRHARRIVFKICPVKAGLWRDVGVALTRRPSLSTGGAAT